MEFEIVDITKRRIFKVWWCLLWRLYLGCLTVVIVVEGISFCSRYCVFRLMGEVSKETIALLEVPGSVLGMVLLIYINFVVVRFIFKKKFSDFEIVLVAREGQRPKYEEK